MTLRAPIFERPDVRLFLGDCVAVMGELPAASVASIVTDPPYGLGFLGHAWDRLDGARAWTTAARQVLAPGGYLLAFGGTRTFHRLAVAIEDAGFEIRDTVLWLHGSGFPKNLDVAKAIDKAAGAVRPRVPGGVGSKGGATYSKNGGFVAGVAADDAPITEDARAWAGWGTALKPAWEPIILARKPLAAPTVAANVLRYGTGALNVDGCRIGPDTPRWPAIDGRRWPANLVLDATAAAMLDEQSGPVGGGFGVRGRGDGGAFRNDGAFPHERGDRIVGYGDSGGASRFFYTAKADADDRDGSKHPTVKPLDLMRWLIKLVTPPAGVVLDPFVGSGATIAAARALGYRAIGIEQDAAWMADAVNRLRQEVFDWSAEP
jgi:DNA modification methylase